MNDTRILLLLILKRAIDDYYCYQYTSVQISTEDFETAVDFLFDTEYCINWGNLELTLEDILIIIFQTKDINLSKFRNSIADINTASDYAMVNVWMNKMLEDLKLGGA